jgi:hypothetical protein
MPSLKLKGYLYLVWFDLVLVVLGFELGVLHLQGWCSLFLNPPALKLTTDNECVGYEGREEKRR